MDGAKSYPGALSFYDGVMTVQATGVANMVEWSGTLADELRSGSFSLVNTDARLIAESSTTDGETAKPFTNLQLVRANARLGRGLLRQYAPSVSTALVGHLYAIEAMADVELAELYCSGIPLSTVDYNGDVTPQAGSSSEQVYQTAVALFDSALTLSSDSARIMNFARVGKARALVDLAQYAEAAQAVASVPTNFRYLVEFYNKDNGFKFTTYLDPHAGGVIGTSEGINGIAFATRGDWRTDTAKTTLSQSNAYGYPLRQPFKYDASGNTSIILASGVEARLIEAEADLAGGGSSWLTILNTLRTSCTPGVASGGAGYPAQTGTDCSPVLLTFPGTPTDQRPVQLPPIVDPGTAAARVDSLFSERAAWLYLTGHRNGDLRRLIRQYGRTDNAIYPIGPYAVPPQVIAPRNYGTDVTLPVPSTERANNPLYSGCISRGA